jgi:hypothetical protein
LTTLSVDSFDVQQSLSDYRCRINVESLSQVGLISIEND